MASLERKRLAGPEPLQDRQRFIDELGAGFGVGRFTHVAEPEIVRGTQAHWEDQPAARQAVDGHGLPGELPGPATRWSGDDEPETDPLRPDRHRGQHDPRVVNLHVADGDRVVVEDAVPAGRLRFRREIGHLARVASVDDDAESHAA